MIDILLFGGTVEGRMIAEKLDALGIPALVCVATGYGEAMLTPGETVRVHTGRLDADGMVELMRAESPRLVIDATHPYAAQVSETIKAACDATSVSLVRVVRAAQGESQAVSFRTLDELVAWLNTQPGVIFSTLGAKEVKALTGVQAYAERVWLRVLPDEKGLAACLSAGFPPKHIICMQGPFSEELNIAIFRATGAQILITKETGAAGGYADKLSAANVCGMQIAVLARPAQETGLSLEQLLNRLEEHTL